ncbi:MAG TPA: asparagine synthase (glutamine-hydrolyzing) [Anaeromyxobacteraceae bacterium]|jgi:asparagine synthase (glutamine-hydrolysing)|nr:asparagine synthase (glutamine-hydrolyzing) [Anaeromyxobacteraceae bacterium]
MCGIAGFSLPVGLHPPERRARHGEQLRRMTAAIGHRGPDAQRGVLLDGIALGHARLAIVDLEGGAQPMRDPASGAAIVFNGEIFNHPELRRRLEGAHRFRTRSDTEVLLAAWLAWGPAALDELNGQFAFALWEPRSRALWLARDRVGILPLFYAETAHGLAFASEVKALFAGGCVEPALDAGGLKETFQLWAPVAPRTCFERVRQLPPRSVACFREGRLEVRRYWDLDLSARAPAAEVDEARAQAELDERLEDAVRLRLRADVPVAAYLSGGLDSSLICAIANHQLHGTLSTFSLAFEDARYDERGHQEEAARHLGTCHRALEIRDRATGDLLPEAVVHAEQALLRSAPAPFLALSAFVRRHGIKVVLTGEGSDEAFLGYDIFKETKVRQFWARDPSARWRAALLRRLYPSLPPVGEGSAALLEQFYGAGLEEPGRVDFSHLLRWASSGRVLRFCAAGFLEETARLDPVEQLLASLPARVAGWRPLARAQYLEMETLLSGYLLSAQGDRMQMAHGVEARFPFLDHRLLELAARLPERLKLRGLREKYLLRRCAERWLPASLRARTKFPYRAPVATALVGPAAPEWAREVLSPEAVRATAVFDAGKVARLAAKLAPDPARATEADSTALMAVASTQLLARAFLGRREWPDQAGGSFVLEPEAEAA